MSKNMENKLYKNLTDAVDMLPKEAVEKADKSVTRKGYDTTGYQYQFLVNVMNEVLGIDGWGFTYTIVKEHQGAWGSIPRPFHEVTVDVKVFIGEAMRQCVGGHKADSYADALKGAITNGFKKTVALFGVGKKAYEGTLDEDYRAGNDAVSYSPKTTQSEQYTYKETTASKPPTSNVSDLICPLCPDAEIKPNKSGKGYHCSNFKNHPKNAGFTSLVPRGMIKEPDVYDEIPLPEEELKDEIPF